jgi:catechol 2,3-dioxygenase-like lactoylglutathione lyase family enzyme
MRLDFAGAVLDLAVTNLDRSDAFYTALLGRPADLRPQADQREWRLHNSPEVAFRITAEPESAGHGKLALGVADLGAERARLVRHWADLPAITEKSGVIALLRFADPDNNKVTLWQDLLGSRRRP